MFNHYIKDQPGKQTVEKILYYINFIKKYF